MRVQTETGQLKLTLKDLNDRGSYQENSTPKRARHEKIHFCSGSGRYVPVSSSISADDDEILDFLPAILSGVKANPPTPPPTPPKPTPPPLPPGVTVLPTQSYLKDYSGDLQIVGEIYNNTTSSIKYVEINANVFNGTSLVATDFTYTVRDIVPPKTKACFKIYTDYPGAYTRVDFEPVSYWNTSDRQPSLSLSNISKQTDYSGDIKIIGMIKNNESISVDYPSIIGTYYNSSGKVIDCNFTFANTYPLAQGQSSSFEMYTNAAANITVNYALQTDGNL